MKKTLSSSRNLGYVWPSLLLVVAGEHWDYTTVLTPHTLPEQSKD